MMPLPSQDNYMICNTVISYVAIYGEGNKITVTTYENLERLFDTITCVSSGLQWPMVF